MNPRQATSWLLVILIAILGIVGATLAAAQTEQVIYSFRGGGDGYYPAAPLIADKAGYLYGTTFVGGSNLRCDGELFNGLGCGTVFQLAPPSSGGEWSETVLHRFAGGDGAHPAAPLIVDSSGNIYGTTSGGGLLNCNSWWLTVVVGCGTVFELERTSGDSWTEKVLYSFQGVPSGNGFGDGAVPNGIVFGRDGNIYGMTYSGGYCYTWEAGVNCFGTVFKLTKPASPGGNWTETVLHDFSGGASDCAPSGPIFDKAGNLYGRAFSLFTCGGFGEVFQLTPPAWAETIIYAFQEGNDGGFPTDGLAFDKVGNLWGTTAGGGLSPDGTIFQLAPPAQPGGFWTESTIHKFAGGNDGFYPAYGLVLDGQGNFYGTTTRGGAFDEGTLFQLKANPAECCSWTKTTLSFSAGTADGGPPTAVLFGKDGALYGATSGENLAAEGCRDYPCGVIFRIGP